MKKTNNFSYKGWTLYTEQLIKKVFKKAIYYFGEDLAISKAEKMLLDPELLTHILREFDKDHIGDSRAKLFVFLSELSGKLPKQYRFSCALLGDSSEGKTNIWNTTSQYLPSHWYKALDRITGSCIEDELEHTSIIFFKELNKKGLNGNNIDYIKALVEDGLDIIKKDVKDEYKSAVERHIERKVGIFSSTGSMDDDELANRYCLVPIVGNQAKYAEVNKEKKIAAGNWKIQQAKRDRGQETGWVAEALKMLDHEIHYVEIPGAEYIEERNDRARSMRDTTRFLNLIAVVAWLHQKQRIIKEENGNKILVASAEDVYNAYEIGEDIFSQSYTQIDARSKETLDTILELLRKEGEDKINYEGVGVTKWINRVSLQAELNLNSVNAIKKRLKPLRNAGLIEQRFERGNSRSYISFKGDIKTGHATNMSYSYHLSITDLSLNSFLKISPMELYTKILTGQSIPNDKSNDISMTGTNKQIKSALIKFTPRKDTKKKTNINRPINKIYNSIEKKNNRSNKKGNMPVYLETTDRSNKKQVKVKVGA